jgi:hypothetical protein
MVEVDEILEINGEQGKVCYKSNFDNKDYVCIGFLNGNKVEFKFFEVKEEDNKLLTREIDDLDTLKKLASDFMAQTVEMTGLTDDFLNVFDR